MKELFRILAINPGSSSTKLGLFENTQALFVENIIHTRVELGLFKNIYEQEDFRAKVVETFIVRHGLTQSSLDAVVGRGGPIKPLPSGTYRVNEAMLNDLRHNPAAEHVSLLGGKLSYMIASRLGIPAYIVDPVSVDEMILVARLSGFPDLIRSSLSHALNIKAVCRLVAVDMGKPYGQLNLVVAHLGSGISVTAHRAGRMVDVSNANEGGPFSPERAGGLPTCALIKLCFSGRYTEQELLDKLINQGGLKGYLGTADVREVERRIDDGDDESRVVYESMIYQIAKEIGSMAASLGGSVDAIVITGGMARSNRLMEKLNTLISFLGPVKVYSGEDELKALASGALQVLRKDEEELVYE